MSYLKIVPLKLKPQSSFASNPMLSPMNSTIFANQEEANQMTDELLNFINNNDSDEHTNPSHLSTKQNSSATNNLIIIQSLEQIKNSDSLMKKPKKKKRRRMQKGKIRLDKFGNQIVKGQKDHKISFATNLVEVTVIDNWKKFNKQTYEEATTCACLLF